MAPRTLLAKIQKGEVVPDGYIPVANGNWPAFFPHRVEELRQINEQIQQRKRDARARAEEKRLAQAKKKTRLEHGEDFENGLRRVVNQAYLDGTLAHASPHFNSDQLPYSEVYAAQAAERTAE
jgi:hypothetical protein